MRGESGTRRAALFPVEGAHIGAPGVRARDGRLKEVLLRDKPEVIRLPRGKLFFLPAGFFVGLRPPTNIHSRLTPLFTVCGCLSGSPHPLPSFTLTIPLIGISYVALSFLSLSSLGVAPFSLVSPREVLTASRAIMVNDEYLLQNAERADS